MPQQRRITEPLAAKGIHSAHRKVIVELPEQDTEANPKKIMLQEISIWKTIHQAFSILFILFFLNGCGMPKPEMLMSTPVLFSDSSIDPFLHLSEEDKTTETSIFYLITYKAKLTFS